MCSIAALTSVGSAFNDTGQIKKLNLGAFVHDVARNTSQGCELVGSNAGLGAGQSRQQRRFTDGRETNERHTGVTRFADVKPYTSRPTPASRLQQLHSISEPRETSCAIIAKMFPTFTRQAS